MPLDRNTVDKAAGAHIRQIQQVRRVSEDEKREIRKLHERIARKVEQNAK